MSPDKLDTSEGKELMEQIFMSRKRTKRPGPSRTQSFKSLNVVSDSESDAEVEAEVPKETSASNSSLQSSGSRFKYSGHEEGAAHESPELRDESTPLAIATADSTAKSVSEVLAAQTPIHDRFSAGRSAAFLEKGTLTRHELERIERSVEHTRKLKSQRARSAPPSQQEKFTPSETQSATTETVTATTPGMVAVSALNDEDAKSYESVYLGKDKMKFHVSHTPELAPRPGWIRWVIALLILLFLGSLAGNLYFGV